MKRTERFKYLFLALAITFIPFSVVVADTIEAGTVKALDLSQLEMVIDLETQDKTDITGFPKEVLDMQGKKVKVTGYLGMPFGDFYDNVPVYHFYVLKYAYGCPCCNWANNPRPSMFNTVFVDLKKGAALNPPFTSRVDVIGTFMATREYNIDVNGEKTLGRLFFIEDAEAKKIDPGWLGFFGF